MIRGAFLLFAGFALSVLADHPAIQCCAGNDGDADGSYCSDLQMLADFDDELHLFAGHYGSDVEGSRYSLYLNKEGEAGIEDSVAGWYLRPSEDNTAELEATAWFKCREKCVTYDFPADMPLPRACFGAGTLLPRLVATNEIDEELTSNTYAPDKDAEHHMKVAAAVHESTCSPMWIVAGPSDDESPSSPASRLRAHPHLLSPLTVLGGLRGNKSSKLSKKGHNDSDDWGILFFVNGTANVPDDKYFGVPSYCDERARKQQ